MCDIGGLVQDCSNSSALAVECTETEMFGFCLISYMGWIFLMHSFENVTPYFSLI